MTNYAGEWLTESEAAAWLGVPETTLRLNVRRGRVPCLRISKRALRFHKPTLIALAQPKAKR